MSISEGTSRKGGIGAFVAGTGIGTLAIPCTTGLVAGAKHPEEAKKLIDYLLSKEVEDKLAAVHFSRYSVCSSYGANSSYTHVCSIGCAG